MSLDKINSFITAHSDLYTPKALQARVSLRPQKQGDANTGSVLQSSAVGLIFANCHGLM